MLNHVWSTGEPNADLSKAGVLVHAFDNTEAFDPGPWLPCPESEWCRQFGDRISASVINQRQPTVFTQSTAGLVLSPQTDIHCSYVADGGTMSKFCGPGAPAACVPGCADRTTGEPAWCETGSVNIWDCAFRPTDVEVMLRHHRNERATAYNEVVVDPRNWEQRLPEMLLAIYYLRTPGLSEGQLKGGEQQARNVHQRFLQRYPRARTPIVSLDTTKADGAFELVGPPAASDSSRR